MESGNILFVECCICFYIREGEGKYLLENGKAKFKLMNRVYYREGIL